MNRVFCKDLPPNFLKLWPQKTNEDKGFQYIFPKLGVLFPQLKTQKPKKAIHRVLFQLFVREFHFCLTSDDNIHNVQTSCFNSGKKQ